MHEIAAQIPTVLLVVVTTGCPANKWVTPSVETVSFKTW